MAARPAAAPADPRARARSTTGSPSSPPPSATTAGLLAHAGATRRRRSCSSRSGPATSRPGMLDALERRSAHPGPDHLPARTARDAARPPTALQGPSRTSAPPARSASRSCRRPRPGWRCCAASAPASTSAQIAAALAPWDAYSTLNGMLHRCACSVSGGLDVRPLVTLAAGCGATSSARTPNPGRVPITTGPSRDPRAPVRPGRQRLLRGADGGGRRSLRQLRPRSCDAERRHLLASGWTLADAADSATRAAPTRPDTSCGSPTPPPTWTCRDRPGLDPARAARSAGRCRATMFARQPALSLMLRDRRTLDRAARARRPPG